MSLKWAPCIYYPLRFWKDTANIKALIDLVCEVNAMTMAYTSKLGFKVHHTNVGAQMINSSNPKTFGMILAKFQLEDKLKKARFFQETCLLPNISVEIFLGMPFLTLSNPNVQFVKKEFTWKFFIIAKTLPTTKWVELINKKEFAKVAFDEKSKILVVYVASFNLASGIHLDRAAQIASLLIKEVKILDKYSDFIDVFSEEKTLVLPE